METDLQALSMLTPAQVELLFDRLLNRCLTGDASPRTQRSRLTSLRDRVVCAGRRLLRFLFPPLTHGDASIGFEPFVIGRYCRVWL